MEVSFTGINNIYVGYRPLSSTEIKTIIPEATSLYDNLTMRFRGNLTDDATGQDLSDFKNLIAKVKTYSQRDFFNHEKPDEVSLDVQYAIYNDVRKKNAMSRFILNGVDVPLHCNKDLAVYTYMAKFTKRIASLVHPNENKETFANFANDIIHSTAVQYIER